MQPTAQAIPQGEKPVPVFTTFRELNPEFRETVLRYQIRCRHDNGLADSGSLVKVGHAWWIFQTRYFSWLADKAVGHE